MVEILQTEFEPRAEAKDLTLRITGCSDIILMGDRNRLVQIGNNLLSNAIKFTESGTVGLDMAYEAGKLVLTVQDTGTGMSHEQKEKIFEPFERLPNAAVKDGFGLFFCSQEHPGNGQCSQLFHFSFQLPEALSGREYIIQQDNILAFNIPPCELQILQYILILSLSFQLFAVFFYPDGLKAVCNAQPF